MVGAAVAAAILVVVLVFGGIPGVSLNAPSSSPFTHHIIFGETGLPSGTAWIVTIQNVNETHTESLSSSGTTISVAEARGTYFFTVPSAAGYTASPSEGQVVVNGSDVSVPIAFSQAVPLGTALSWGPPANETGTVFAGCPTTTGHYCYVIEIGGAGHGLATSNIVLSLRNEVGSTIHWPTGIVITLFSPTSTPPLATYDTPSGTWALVPPYDGALASGLTLVFYTAGTGAGNGLLGLELVAIGQNGFSGTVQSAAFP